VKNIAIILAGGSGTRSGFDRPKQMIKLAGKPIISHTIKAFNSSPLIDEIAVIVSGEIYEQACFGRFLFPFIFKLPGSDSNVLAPVTKCRPDIKDRIQM
jgi:molybdopterin-guanine dinucleotide biosynthesis protein A